MKLVLKRAGTFKCNWRSGDNVCGHGVSGIQKYSYSCEIVSDNNSLDEHGFIVDQLDVDKTFQTMFHPDPHQPKSCELMALEFVAQIKYLARRITPTRVTVSVGPIPPPGAVGEASITAEWVL